MKIPTTNRGYTLAFITIIGFTLLCGIVLWKSPNQFTFILDSFTKFALGVLGATLFTKETGKAVTRIFGKSADNQITEVPDEGKN